MPDRDRHGLHAVKPNESRERESRPDLKAQIRSHRFKIFLRTAILIAAVVALIVGVYLYFAMRSYDSYEVQSETDRADTAATHFAQYGSGLLKYSNDGAFYTDLDNNLIWNQTYEMEHPAIDISDSYVAIADIGGMEIFTLNETSAQGRISTTVPIYAFSVASQGTVAVLLQGSDTFYLKLYDAAGSELASGQLYSENSGYPLALSISPDGRKLALASILPTGSDVTTTVTFYNFGSVGQNEPDNIVGSFSYENLVIAEMNFLSDDTLAAFGDRQLQIYTGAQKPELRYTLDVTEEIKSICVNENYIGLVFNNEDEENTRRLEVYDKRLRNVLTRDFALDYHTVELLPDNEICIRNDYECLLLALNGVERFSYQFDRPLYQVVEEHFGIYYTFVMEGTTARVRLT